MRGEEEKEEEAAQIRLSCVSVGEMREERVISVSLFFLSLSGWGTIKRGEGKDIEALDLRESRSLRRLRDLPYFLSVLIAWHDIEESGSIPSSIWRGAMRKKEHNIFPGLGSLLPFFQRRMDLFFWRRSHDHHHQPTSITFLLPLPSCCVLKLLVLSLVFGFSQSVVVAFISYWLLLGSRTRFRGRKRKAKMRKCSLHLSLWSLFEFMNPRLRPRTIYYRRLLPDVSDTIA